MVTFLHIVIVKISVKLLDILGRKLIREKKCDCNLRWPITVTEKRRKLPEKRRGNRGERRGSRGEMGKLTYKALGKKEKAHGERRGRRERRGSRGEMGKLTGKGGRLQRIKKKLSERIAKHFKIKGLSCKLPHSNIDHINILSIRQFRLHLSHTQVPEPTNLFLDRSIPVKNNKFLLEFEGKFIWIKIRTMAEVFWKFEDASCSVFKL